MVKRRLDAAEEDGDDDPPEKDELREEVEVVRKMTLKKGLRLVGEPRVAFLQTEHVSRLGHIGSLVCNAVIHRVVDGESVPCPYDWKKDSTL
jgi:hypothetical protein